MKSPPRPHDLLFLRLPDRFDTGGDHAWPAWLDAAWLTQAPLVVRREAAPGSLLPVGARGLTRSQRCKGYVQRDAVARCVTPETLARRHLRAVRAGECQSDLAPLRALAALAPRLKELGLVWGPTGGAGFYLASGLPVLRADSDLDLLVRAPGPLPAWIIERLLRLQERQPCRVDIQVDTGLGGFALNEYARGGRVLLKTAHGPVLSADPWRVPEPDREAA